MFGSNNLKNFRMLIQLILTSFVISIVSITYIKILAFQDVLNWWFKFGLKYEKKWFYPIVWGCQYCFAGQFALWTYLINWIGFKLQIVPEIHFQNFSLFWLVFFICQTIFTTFIVSKFYDVTNNLK